MTVLSWILLVAYVVTGLLAVGLYVESRRLARLFDEQGAMYRAAYRDLITQYERLHTKYKELQRDSD